jgi:hypothetical protein
VISSSATAQEQALVPEQALELQLELELELGGCHRSTNIPERTTNELSWSCKSFPVPSEEISVHSRRHS